MKDLVTDAISFFKMIGAANELSEKGFDNQDIMTVEYCDKITGLCEKYNIVCDNTMPYGILNAEDLLYDFFKESLERAIGGE